MMRDYMLDQLALTWWRQAGMDSKHKKWFASQLDTSGYRANDAPASVTWRREIL